MTKRLRSGSIHIGRAGESGVAEGARAEQRPAEEFSLGVSHPSARLESGTPWRLVKPLDRLARHDPLLLEDAAVQEHLREASEVGRGAEEARVRGDAAEGGRVLVVHLAAQDVGRARDRSRWARCAASSSGPGR